MPKKKKGRKEPSSRRSRTPKAAAHKAGQVMAQHPIMLTEVSGRRAVQAGLDSAKPKARRKGGR